MNRQSGNRFDAVLFDLDGTLVDTALDMVAVLLQMQQDHDQHPVSYNLARSYVSNGAAGLIGLAFPNANDAQRQQLHAEYLERYGESVCISSRLFPHLPELLDTLDQGRCPWGVVTNKPARLTEPLLAALGLHTRTGCAISGDTLPQRKPDPAPLLLACSQIETEPERTIYVGDAARDIEAGRAAGMYTVAAAYGYITDDDDPLQWRADKMAEDPKELSAALLEAVWLRD